MACRWQVEIDPFCRAVLAKHWPDVKRYEDVRRVHARVNGEARCFCWHCLEAVDVLCGGFPCQDISNAGPRTGIDGERSGLWREFDRLIGELRPRYVLVENTAALLGRGLSRVLGDLAARGYDAEWAVVSACAFDAPHTRERLFIVAYPRQERRRSGLINRGTPARTGSADQLDRQIAESCRARLATWWQAEPEVGRLAYGVPDGVGQLAGLGNAVVPQIAEWIGRRIIDAEVAQRAA